MSDLQPSRPARGAACAVVSDDPGRALMIAAYGEDGAAVAVPLTPHRALTIAGELIEAARRRLD